MDETETRAEHIDPALHAAGWGVVEGSRVRREFPITPGRLEGAGRRGKALTADYVLEYALPPLTREQRAEKAKVEISTHFNSRQQVFLDFVLSHYVSAGVDELAQEKPTPLLRLRYHDSIADAVADLGKPDEIGRAFAGFQRHLYESA